MAFVFGQIDFDIIAVAGAGPESSYTAGGQPLLLHDPFQHGLCILKQGSGALANHFVGQDCGIISGKFPGAEKRGPIEHAGQIGQIPVCEDMQPGLFGRRGLVGHVGLEAVGAGVLQAEQNGRVLARTQIADVLVFCGGRGDERFGLGIGEQLAGHPNRAAGVEHVDHRAIIGRIDPQRGVDLAGGRAADQQRHGQPSALHFFGHGDHFIQRRRDQARQADHVGILLNRGFDDLGPGHHHAQIDHFVAVALQHDADDVLADIVDIALDRGHHDLALGPRARLLGGFDIGDQVGDRLFHHPGRFDHLRQEHLAGAKQIANGVHPGHQRAFNHFDRAGMKQAGFLGVLDDMRVDPFDQSMLQPPDHIPAAPFRSLLFSNRVGALEALGHRDQPFGRAIIAVEDHILASGAQRGVDQVVNVKLPGVDDCHVEPGRDCVVEEHRMHRPADRLVAAEAERQVGEPAREVNVRAARADFGHRFDEIDRVIVVLFDPRRDREDVGIKNDVFGRKADPGQQFISPLTDFDLAGLGIGLALFVEGHHHHGGAIIHAQPGVVKKGVLALFHRDRVDDRLA